jgi:hypothetical protein
MMAPDPRWVGGQERSMRNLTKVSNSEIFI